VSKRTMAIVIRDEGRKITSGINVTPMVDVMLVLLIIFMVVVPLIQRHVTVDMAKVDHPIAMPDADKEDSIVVGVSRDGRIYLGSDQIMLEQLTIKVKDKLDRKTDKRVFVKADARAKYGVIVEVVDNIRSANVEALGLLTEQNKSTTPPSPPSDTSKKTELTI
jgi:biopolymer transport protein TolR